MTLLKHVASIRVSNVDKKLYEGETPVRLCNYTDVYYGDSIRADDGEYMTATASADQLRSFRLEAGDIVLTKDSETAGDIGISAYIAKGAPDFVCGYHLAVVRPDERVIEPRFLFWASRSDAFTSQLAVSATGVTRYGLRTDAIANVELQLPTRDAQRRIADFLDDQIPRLERAIALRLRQRELLNETRTAALSRCMTGEPSNAREHKVLGRVSSTTEPTKLIRALHQIAVGVVVNPSTYFVDEGVPFIHGYNVRDGWLDMTEYKRMLPTDSDSLPRSRLIGGEVLVVRAGYPGRAAVVPEELAGANCASVLVLRCAPTILPEYLATFFNAPQGRGQVRVGQYGAAQEVISAGQVAEYTIPLVPLAEQRQRIGDLHGQLEALDRAQVLGEHHRSLLEERKQALITAAVTGRLDVTTARGVA